MRQRRETVEHPFGTLKARMGATHFLMKRLPKVATEMALHVLAYNLTRVMNIMGIAAARGGDEGIVAADMVCPPFAAQPRTARKLNQELLRPKSRQIAEKDISPKWCSRQLLLPNVFTRPRPN